MKNLYARHFGSAWWPIMNGDGDHLLRSCSTLDHGLDMITQQNGGAEAGSYDEMIAATRLYIAFLLLEWRLKADTSPTNMKRKYLIIEGRFFQVAIQQAIQSY